MDTAASERISLGKSIPFFLVHLASLGALWTGVSAADVALCVGLYYLRMFALTAGYHRYFSHRAFRTNRVFQFLLAFWGTTCTQKGALWWAAHHRRHHRYSDTPEDIHSPVQKGFWWSHVGWILSSKYDETEWKEIPDLAKYPELRWLNTWHLVPPVMLAAGLFLAGGWSALVWGYFVSTTILWHGTFTINSLSHVFGTRRYATTDTSKNNFWLALLTMGEGWHNNHHHYPGSARQGFFWWEIDVSYYFLRALSLVGLVRGLRQPPGRIIEAGRKRGHSPFWAIEKVLPVKKENVPFSP